MKRGENRRTIAFSEDLRSEDSLYTLAEAIQRPDITGRFDYYLYCVENGRQVLLGHNSIVEPMGPGSTASTIQYIFVTQGNTHHHRTETWEELRDYLRQGWIIGTVKQPGAKLSFMDTGRNNRRVPERIFVFRSR